MTVSLLKGFPSVETYFATRYDSARDELIAVLADEAEGYGSWSTGNVECLYGFVQYVKLDASCDLDFTDHTNYPVGDEAGEIARTYGITSDMVIGRWFVTSNDQGFVTVESVDTDEEAAVRMAHIESYYAAWSDEDREDTDAFIYVCSAPGHGYESL